MMYVFNIKTLRALLNLKPEKYETVQGIEFLRLHDWFPQLVAEHLLGPVECLLTSLKTIPSQYLLTEISIRNTNLGTLSDDCFREFCDILSGCKDLEKIHFCPETLAKLSAERLEFLMKALLHCETLKEISLEGNCIGEWDNDRLKILGRSLLCFNALKIVRLRGNNLDGLKNFGYQVLFGFLSLSSVEELYLEGNNIGLSNINCLTELGRACAQMKTLKLLNISDNRLDDSGIPGFQAFFNSLAPSCLQTLNLEANGLGNANLPPQCFTVLGKVCGKFKNLQILSLAKNQFNQLKEVCFTKFKDGIIQSNTLCEIAGIHTFSASHQEKLRKALCEIITRNEEPEKENWPIDNTLEPKAPTPKRLFFAHGSSPAELGIAPMTSKVADLFFNSTNTKRLKIGENTT